MRHPFRFASMFWELTTCINPHDFLAWFPTSPRFQPPAPPRLASTLHEAALANKVKSKVCRWGIICLLPVFMLESNTFSVLAMVFHPSPLSCLDLSISALSLFWRFPVFSLFILISVTFILESVTGSEQDVYTNTFKTSSGCESD